MALKTDFSINVNTSVDTSNIQKQLNQVTKSKRYVLKVNLDLDSSIKDIEKKISNLFTKSNANLGERIGRSFQKGVTGVDKFGKSIKNCNAYIETFKNSFGDVTERMTVLTEGGKIVGQTFNQIKTGITDITNTTTNFVRKVGGVEQNVTRLTKVITDTNGATKAIVEETKKWTDANGKLNESVTTYEKVGNQLKQISPTVTSITSSMEKAKKSTQSFYNILEKVGKFYLASLPIRAVQKAITETVEAVKEFDKAYTEMAKVTELSGEALKQYTIELGNLGTEVGRTRKEMTELATGFLKAGFSEEETKQLAEYGALLQNTADEQLEASEATSIIVSALKAFDLQSEETLRVLDDINITSQEFAVSSADISRGLTQAGASMATYGNSLEQTIGLITAGENFLPVTD